MKNAKSKIRFIELFAITTFPLALAVGCTTTGEQNPSGISMQESTYIEQQAAISTDELNTLAFAETEPSDSEPMSSEQESITQSNADAKDTQTDTQEMDVAELVDTDTQIHDANVASAIAPVNMQIPERGVMKKPDTTILHFAVNKFEISEQNLAILKIHADYLQDNPSTLVNVNGYSDSRGSAKLNFELSEKRAQRVADILINYGIEASRIKVNSYGESFPLHDEKNWDENRRVELQYSETPEDDGLMASVSID